MINNTQTKYQFLLQLFYGTENFFCTIERVQFLSFPQKLTPATKQVSQTFLLAFHDTETPLYTIWYKM